jgi:hypothetical protein
MLFFQIQHAPSDPVLHKGDVEVDEQANLP